MLKHLSNTASDTTCLVGVRLALMHASAERLYKAAKDLCNTVGQSNLARLLVESPQTVENWETRGVSNAGCVKAEGRIGCRAYWVSTGEGEMRCNAPMHSDPRQPGHLGLEAALEIIGVALARTPADLREALASNMAGWARDGGRGPWQSIVSSLLQAPSTKRQHA